MKQYFKVTIKLQNYFIFSKESFSYISRNGILHFSGQAREIKKTHPKKISDTRKGTPPPPPPKKNHYISGNGTFLYFGKLNF